MNDPDGNLSRHKDDFGRVCDLEDPCPCVNALLHPEDRMPEVALKALHRAVSESCAQAAPEPHPGVNLRGIA